MESSGDSSAGSTKTLFRLFSTDRGLSHKDCRTNTFSRLFEELAGPLVRNTRGLGHNAARPIH